MNLGFKDQFVPFVENGTGLVALRNGRRYVGIELSPEYIELSRERIDKERWLWDKANRA